MSENTNNDRSTKYSNWANRVVADQTGKSYFESMAPEQFSEFLYALMRYRNKSLFATLATILRPSKEQINYFWRFIFADNLSMAVQLLDSALLLKKPENWTFRNFDLYVSDRVVALEKEGGAFSDEKYGKSLYSAYLLHAQTEYFFETLKDKNLTALEWERIMSDWKEIAEDMRSKNHYFRNRLLRQIVESAIRIQDRIVRDITASGKEYKSDWHDLYKTDMKLFDWCQGADQRIFLALKATMENGWHAFGPDEYVILTEQIYGNMIALRRNNQKSCAWLGREFFEHAFGRSSKSGFQQNPDCLDIAATLWGEDRRKKATKQYGPYKTEVSAEEDAFKVRPFHETIVETINKSFSHDLYGLIDLIRVTKIPANHDAIIQALEIKLKALGLYDKTRVCDQLRKQKEAMPE